MWKVPGPEGIRKGVNLLDSKCEFMGYRRADGSIGIRNYLLLIPTVICSNQVVAQIGASLPSAVALQHQHGCSQLGDDLEQTFRTLAGLGKNPNVGAVVVIGLGCEAVAADRLAAEIATTGKPVECFQIQETGGTVKTIKEAGRKARMLWDKMAGQEREPACLSEILLAGLCEGPDLASLHLANPAVGYVIDRHVSGQGRAMIGEVPELLVVEEEVVSRMENACEAAAARRVFARWRQCLTGGDPRLSPTPEPCPPLKDASLTGVQRAQAALSKAGKAPFQSVRLYAEAATGPGLHLMDTPENSLEAVTGMVAGGAQVVLFTTGSGVPTGAPVAPVIKITASYQACHKMQDHIDVDLTPLLTRGVAAVEAAGELVWEVLQVVANGRKTRSEILGYEDLAINRIGPSV